MWELVGAPGRLSEWTDAGPPTPAPSQWTTGAQFTVPQAGGTAWSVISTGQRVVEVAGDTPCGRLGVGVRVIGVRTPGDTTAPVRSRVVFVARLRPAGSPLRARLRHVPALRRRFDRWALLLRQLTG